MQRIKNFLARFVAANMRSHDLIAVSDLDTVDIALDRYGPEGRFPRDAVVHVVEAGELVLVDFRRLANAGVEAGFRQRGGVPAIVCESLGNRTFRIT